MTNLSHQGFLNVGRFITLLLLQILLFGFVTLGFVGTYNGATLWFFIPTLIYGMFRLTLLGQADSPRWGISLLWLYGVYIALIPGMVQVTNDTYFWSVQGDYSPQVVLAAVGMMCLGLLITDVTYIISRARDSSPKHELLTLQPPPVHLWALTGFVALAGVWSLYLIGNFGLGFFLQTRGATGSVLELVYSKAEMGMQLNLGTALLIALLIFCIDLVTMKTIQNQKPALWFLFIIVLILNFIINSPLRMARYVLFGVIFAIVFVLYKNRIIQSKIHFFVILFFAPALYFLFRFMGVYSRGTETDLNAALSAAFDLKGTLVHGDFDGLQMHILGINHVMQEGFHWGQQILGSILFFIPRDIWAFKATPSSTLIAESNGQVFTNLSASFYLEGYLDWGWVGVIAMAILLGKLLVKADRATLGNFQSVPSVIFVAFLTIIMRGALLAIIAQVASTIFWAWLMTKTITGKPKHV